MQMELSREHYVTHPDDGKEVRETQTKVTALSDVSGKESRKIPRA